MIRRNAYIVIAASALAATRATAQSASVPFFFAQPTSVEAEIGVVATGVSQTVSRAEVVGPDRRYVTLDINTESDAFLGFRTFSFSGPAGFVGSAAAQQAVTNAAAKAAGASAVPAAKTAEIPLAAQVSASATVLERPGITLIQPLFRR